MTRDDIIRMAREIVGDVPDNWVCRFDFSDLERFAALVVAAEREKWVKVCSTEFRGAEAKVANYIVTAIRARGER